MEKIKLYIVHKWEMEKFRALTVNELNEANLCEFVDLSGKISKPIDADDSYLQDVLLGRMIEADIIVILIPDPFFMKKEDIVNSEFDYFAQEHMLLEFDSHLAHKPVVPIAIRYKVAEAYSKILRVGEEVRKYNSECSPDSVIPVAIDFTDTWRFANQLKRIAWLEF